MCPPTLRSSMSIWMAKQTEIFGTRILQAGHWIIPSGISRSLIYASSGTTRSGSRSCFLAVRIRGTFRRWMQFCHDAGSTLYERGLLHAPVSKWKEIGTSCLPVIPTEPAALSVLPLSNEFLAFFLERIFFLVETLTDSRYSEVLPGLMICGTIERSELYDVSSARQWGEKLTFRTFSIFSSSTVHLLLLLNEY